MVIPPHETLVAELAELIAIPSVSADPVHADDIRRAADWVVERIRAAGGEAELQERGERPLVIGRGCGLDGRGSADGPRLRAPRRPAARPARALGVRPVDPRRAERLARRPWRRRRQGTPLHAARGNAPPRRRRRAAGERALRDRRGGGGRRPLGHRLGGRGCATRRRGARPRRGLRDREPAVVLHRAPRHVLLPRHRPHGRARPSLGRVRRRRARGDTRADADALRRAPRPGRTPARAAPRGHRRAHRGGAGRLERAAAGRRGARVGRRAAERRDAPPRSSACGRRPSRR